MPVPLFYNPNKLNPPYSINKDIPLRSVFFLLSKTEPGSDFMYIFILCAKLTVPLLQ